MSATGLRDNPGNKYYCRVTIKDLECSNYGTNGERQYIWNNTTPGIMKVMVPTPSLFRITVEYFESCGQYWEPASNPQWGRGKWSVVKETNWFSTISLNPWSFNEKIDC